ncbi:DNA repair protein RecO [Candidatus Roizmanbacteria bacterium]|nr:DNA repair protein RecO [Candidatus Roizmanbacteria bacterium]
MMQIKRLDRRIMTMTVKTEAIVLKKKSLLHKDVLITLFTEEFGKAHVFAKGIKKITSRRLSYTQTGNLIKVVLHENKERLYLSEAQLISAFSEIKKDEEKIQALYCFFFIAERLLPENQKEEAVYNTLKSFEVKLAKERENTQRLLTRYINILMRYLGYVKDKKTFEELISIIESLIHEKLPTFTI